jgi:hypothetical protein
MPRVNNVDTVAETPLPQLQEALKNLKPGEKIQYGNSRQEVLKIRENIIKRRHEIHGADSHLDFIEALLIAEASGQLDFK